ncbi:ABC transporter substrate-binding protein [Micromonospora endophytica]|uniref:Branched-chain amino acid ABC transporter substrate-binding protein n=1 Tax=Micromonospora endophytica TaxID=515350 RepID=A0A2W2C4Z0_9ACTN|nr:ABC transporter substrate-binding protein [Micromonospora endophytica]PZF93622.1 branched-chain amino acid ABC transporter substrate-binding protein [Micromonospora endophytica]RIW46828.1 amino acid ABC transporter substrate-binding protein [Micromonospora endophytica]
MHMSRGSRTAALAACAALLLATSACGDDQAEEATTQQVRLYGTDGNMSNSYADELEDRASLVDGMKGTTPLTPLPEDFKKRLLSVDPQLDGFLYAAEAYDAVVISTLAAEIAGTTDPAAIAKQIVGVTNDGTSCGSPAQCLRLIRDGRDIEYRSVSITRAGFTDAGEPATASYATLHFDGERLNDAKTEFVGAGDESAASSKAPPRVNRPAGAGNGPLVIGGLLPKTGDLALAYPPLAAGTALAIKEINDAGGVLGEDVVWVDGDDGTNPTVAKATVARHIDAGVHVIIGAGGSGISAAVLEDVVQGGRILFSPSNTAASLTNADDNGLYFRTAPPDSLQGRALADVILRDGPQKIAIVARKDSYGEGLQDVVRSELERAGFGGDKVKLLSYEPGEGAEAPPINFSDGAKQIKEFGADAVLIIGFGESAAVVRALADADVPLAALNR